MKLMSSESRHKLLMMETALARLHDLADVIDHRGSLRNDKEKRVTEIKTLLEQDLSRLDSKEEKIRKKYYTFLRKIDTLSD